MWSSSAGNKTSTTNTISSSTSKSSSNTCLCPRTNLTRKSMEEIWKGINLPSLHHHQNPATAVFPPAPATVLSLSNSPGYDGVRAMESPDRVMPDPQSQNHADSGPDPSFLSSLNSPFDALSPSADPFPSFCKKRASENDDGSGNFRHKRMIKNRESAARSRARKQASLSFSLSLSLSLSHLLAYANGLETEVTRLLEENARLRRQVDRYRAAAAAQLPKKQTLTRTLTAPF
ncbi:hypothetical protein RHMOL_Rhmol06G0025900 [Rhododendron molle]|uniref:Uncharacterized protein n=1 Tax=Rhododendron molle TaxID=49168 RepID=A0ACC0N9B7_RHOML|nr:hypothetical protein RHMOL_Rhmol06G0025900 [Rhododendron molle]